MKTIGRRVSIHGRKETSRPGTPPAQFLTLPEVQTYLGIKSRKTILKYIRNGALPAFKLGGTRWRLAKTDVDGFLQAFQHPAEAGARP